MILIVKLDGDLWRAVASPARADKFIDNALKRVLKILLVTAFFASLSEIQVESLGQQFKRRASLCVLAAGV
ncbi:MAG TPA: hypothetical protein VD835_16750 [Pyrinomonadaceae bacterium]|nr:hypothetical protein [Pyrinomonadaceae bacterium]